MNHIEGQMLLKCINILLLINITIVSVVSGSGNIKLTITNLI